MARNVNYYLWKVSEAINMHMVNDDIVSVVSIITGSADMQKLVQVAGLCVVAYFGELLPPSLCPRRQSQLAHMSVSQRVD